MHRTTSIALAVSVLVAGLASTSAGATSQRAKILVQPSSGPPGRFVTIRGSGFCASRRCGPVRIRIYSLFVAKGIRVTSRGTFVKRQVQIPGGTPTGQIGVIASQRLASGAQRQAVATYDVIIYGH